LAIDDVEVGATTDLDRCRGHDGAERLRGAAVFADHLADVVLGDAELEDDVVVTLDLGHVDARGIIHERFRQSLYELLERHGPEAQAAG